MTLASGDQSLFIRQLIWVLAGLFFFFSLPLLNLKAVFNYRWLILGIYFFVLLLLLITYFAAPFIHGARSWLVLGPIQIQPAEFMKASFIILFSSFFAIRHVTIARLRIIGASFIYFIVPTLLVLIQPDLGTALVLFGIWFGYLLVSGLPLRYLLVILIVISILGVLGWQFLLEDYQKDRITALFTPSEDPLGVNYSVFQSKIAIGSAGFFGKGFGQGTQVQLGFLPAAGTDFIFAAFVEEWGILGGTLLIAAFIFLAYRVLQLGTRSANNFGKFFSLGTVVFLLVHFVINLGSTLGVLPVIGIGLPFVSYGGSNLLTSLILLGILQSVVLRKGGF
ncbi:MAG: FtsW/RodA/SpoVE family cell cycle protein [Candidatus Colwellbacteria bacterium]|nr:FtsW/RodA/SpoVE family cell cycle protein [Candidatus Colwellbacteria bacterium]